MTASTRDTEAPAMDDGRNDDGLPVGSADGHRFRLLVRRPGRGMLGGMRALPDDGWSAKDDGVHALTGEWREGGVVRHGFTHFDLELQLMLCLPSQAVNLPEGEWWPVEEIEAAGLPTVFAKAARLAIAERTD